MKSSRKKWVATVCLIAIIAHDAAAFCGFYVSKADGTLKNKTSQIIVVHDGDRSVITMYNDFKGNIKDFAMVVPVPAVLKKSDIKVVDQQIFTLLNEYSQPRLVEYFDQDPCEYAGVMQKLESKVAGVSAAVSDEKAKRKSDNVKIEAKYIVGEYDILILSAKESSGLQTWLTENGYKIPAGAEEVLEPYIKSNLKFFVVKVNENELKKLGGNFLRPIQISFRSNKFMLPIRLGMANSEGDQDMIVYGFSKKGRIECTNYRTVSLPTGKNIPLFVQNNFQNFYSNLFEHQWEREGKSVAMLEYAWDVSPANYLKCDPCVATVPAEKDLLQAGVWWMKPDWNDYSDVDKPLEDEYSSKVFFTRLHIRYNRREFPQDLVFQETPNRENFQARYIVTHPATGGFNCEAGKRYLKNLQERRRDELQMLTTLTGKTYADWDVLARTSEEKIVPVEESYAAAHAANLKMQNGDRSLLIATIGLASLISLAGVQQIKRRR